MLFNSYQFFIFFPIVTLLFFAVPHKYRWFLLLVASCVFYATFIPAYLFILFFLIVVDYFAGKLIEEAKGQRRKQFLIASIIANGGILFFFKYFNFFNENVASVANFLHWNYPIGFLTIALPIGLSFHTFQSLSYVIEVYRGRQKAERHFGIYSLYVMFYPQLVAGPIERPQNLLHQFHEKHEVDYVRITEGLRRILWGFFKKMVIADNLAMYVNLAYGSPDTTSGLALFIATIFFAVQIYCDFSGYADIAVGSAKVMGFTLMENFNIPYASTTVTEFWRRWHISLSSWIRDYLFTPLSIKWRSFGKWGITASLMTAFAFAGLWHGAAWVYIIFGLLHGTALSLEFLTSRARTRLAVKFPVWITKAFGRVYVFFFWCFTLVFFRAGSLSDAFFIIQKAVNGITNVCMLSVGDVAKYIFIIRGSRMWFLFLCGLVSLIVLSDFVDSKKGLFASFSRMNLWLRFIVYFVLAFTIMNLGVTQEIPFIYFQF